MKLKLIYSLGVFILLGTIWALAGQISQNTLTTLEAQRNIPYGPLPSKVNNFYSFSSVERAFDPSLNLNLIKDFSKHDFEQVILRSLGERVSNNFSPFIKETLSLAEEYQVDPFWIISIMMVESHFELNALSNKNARGLMQIQPETAEHLLELMGTKYQSHQSYQDNNIDVGIFYLKKLFQNFRLNYKLATIAYNLGPNKLKNYIEEEKDISNFSYFIKVQESYKMIENSFLLQSRSRYRDASLNLALIPYRNEFFSDYPVQSKFFL